VYTVGCAACPHLLNMSLMMFTGAISTFGFGGRPSSRRPLSGVKVDGRDSREREAQVGAISARALRLNTKTDVWPSGRGGGAHYLEDKHYPLERHERHGQSPGRLAKPPMSAPKVVCAGIRVPYGVLTADETPQEAPLDWPRADGECMRSEKAIEEDGQSGDAGMLSLDEVSRGVPCRASGEDKGAGPGARAQAGQDSVDMWRGAGEDIRFDVGGGIQADADKAYVTKLPGWLFYVPLVIISLEPARKGMWDTLAFSRHAHAQLEGSWTASSGADGVMAAPPANEPPQPHTARAMTQARDNPNTMRVDKLKTSPWLLASLPTETPRRFPDRLMGEQISNVQWRSSLRTNSNVVGLALALPQTPRQQAAKDSLRDPPASERGHALSTGRKLIQSISAVETDSNSYFPVRIMRQVPFFSSCAECVLSSRPLDLLNCLRERASVRPAPAWGDRWAHALKAESSIRSREIMELTHLYSLSPPPPSLSLSLCCLFVLAALLPGVRWKCRGTR
jgi:hypothetical protein